MGVSHLVKIGLMARVGRFSSPDGRRYAPDESVICRTARGLETGSIMCVLDEPEDCASDGDLLRKVTPDDRLIIERIDRFRNKAFQACQLLLQEQGCAAVLVDVEHSFDGQSLFFYFLGDVPEEVHQLTDRLAQTYEKKVRFRKFSETLAAGCGPNCGTESSACSTGGCSSCALSGSCGSKNQESINGST